MNLNEDALYVLWKWLGSRGAIALCKRVNFTSEAGVVMRRFNFTKSIEHAIRVLPLVSRHIQYEAGEKSAVHSCMTYSAYLYNYYVRNKKPCRLCRRDPSTVHLLSLIHI